MKTIELKKLKLINFKGLRNQEVDFDQNTDIYGDNGSGKTTLFDAFTWVLFGKDSSDRKDFEIKTLDSKNQVIPKIEHEVSALLLVDGEEIKIKRVLEENWVKKRGALESEMAGNITKYYWNEVPMQQKEFQSKVSLVLDEIVFKLITNPLSFNSLKWQDRRTALMAIAGSISDADLAAGDSEYEKLVAKLGNDKSLDDYKKQIFASIKKAKDDLKAIPTRIDEISRSKPEEHDFVKLAIELEASEVSLQKVENDMFNKSSAFDEKLKAINVKKSQANSLKSEIQIIEQNSRTEAKKELTPNTSILTNLKAKETEAKQELESSNYALKSLESKSNSLTTDLAAVVSKMDSKRNDWTVENAKVFVFNEEDCKCPTCERAFETDNIEAERTKLQDNFNDEKRNRLLTINNQGAALAAEKSSLENEIKTLVSRVANGLSIIENLKIKIEAIRSEIETEESKIKPYDETQENVVFESILKTNTDYSAKKVALTNLEAIIEDMPTVDVSELQAQQSALKFTIQTIKTQLQNQTQIEAIDKRIIALEEEEKTLAQQIANVEKEQFVIDNFNKLKIDTLESRINEKFQFVKFRMFELQINSAEIECCDALIDGVPFSDANTASKINAGLDVINTLCEFYQVTAPVFLDNRESVIDIIDTKSQIVNLIVSEKDKKLRIEAESSIDNSKRKHL